MKTSSKSWNWNWRRLWNFWVLEFTKFRWKNSCKPKAGREKFKFFTTSSQLGREKSKKSRSSFRSPCYSVWAQIKLTLDPTQLILNVFFIAKSPIKRNKSKFMFTISWERRNFKGSLLQWEVLELDLLLGRGGRSKMKDSGAVLCGKGAFLGKFQSRSFKSVFKRVQNCVKLEGS